MINNSKFYCNNKDTYPPFKNGLYLEEYFLGKFIEENANLSRKYIPALWTNFQIERWFNSSKIEMQSALDQWIINNPSENGYFTIVQYDDGPLLNLPKDTIIFGACSGTLPIPLIYEDKNETLEKVPQKSFKEKNYLCSFVGTITSNNVQPNVREKIVQTFYNNPNFIFNLTNGWTPNVEKFKQDNFINISINSKFGFAPRGYGRSSFRFFELLKLGTIPIYVWNDEEWLPFKDKIDYSKFCISIHVSELNLLEKRLLNITEEDYQKMWEEYYKIKHYFTLEGMYNEIINRFKN